jgi:predicted ATPase
VKTDGVPLFVEELTKMVLESELVREGADGYELAGALPTLAIPSTLQDSLTARLDRLDATKAIAQLGAALGRTFSYELLQAVAPVDDVTLQRSLVRLEEAEVVYRRGVPPDATYVFKHALIQEAAYQSMLRSTRARYHQRIAEILEARFGAICETQPELLAHHYTEAGAAVHAVTQWQRAGERAIKRSANVEAIGHLTRALDVLATMPDGPERLERELALHTALGIPMLAVKGQAAPDVERVYARARELCAAIGDTPQLFPTLWGLWWFYEVRGDIRTAHELAEQLVTLAERQQDSALLIQSHRAMGQTLLWLGEFVGARVHLQQTIDLYDPHQHGALAFIYGQNPGVLARGFLAHVAWYLGYPDTAVRTMEAALALARELSHPFSSAFTLDHSAWLHQYRGEPELTRDRAEADVSLCREHVFPFFMAQGTILRGWALAAQGELDEGMREIHRGLMEHRAIGAELTRPHWLILLAEVRGLRREVSEGFAALAEAETFVSTLGLSFCEAELLRVRGDLLLTQATPDQARAEACFRQAVDVARRQSAKSLELRATVRLARLLGGQGKREDARRILAEIRGWFTEGLDTPDMREATTLLEHLSAA